MREGINVKQSGLFTIVYFKCRDFESLKLIPIGDLHIDAGFDDEKLKCLLKRAKEDEKVFFVFVGDIFDASFFKTFENLRDIKRDLEKLVSILEPYKDRILVMLSGNHDERFLKYAGIDPVGFIAMLLDCPYSSTQALLHIEIGRSKKATQKEDRALHYVGVVGHGYGGGRRTGGKLNKGEDLFTMWEEVDFFILGHVHHEASFSEARFRYNRFNRSVSIASTKVIIPPSLQVYPAYAGRKFLRPEGGKWVEIRLNGRGEKEIEVMVY